MTKSKRSAKSKSKGPYTFIVVQGVTPALKPKYKAAAKRAKARSMSAWMRDTLAKAVK